LEPEARDAKTELLKELTDMLFPDASTISVGDLAASLDSPLLVEKLEALISTE
jgi:hypothetical protein